MKRLRQLSVIISLILLLSSPVAMAWNPFARGCTTGDGSAGGSVVCANSDPNKQDPLTGPNSVIARVTDLLALVTGIAAVIGITVGGIRFITASGDPNGINAAKNTILYSLIGLVVIVFARTIVVYILRRI